MTEVGTIVLADDHRLLRETLRAALEREADLAVVGEADDGVEALDMVMRLDPDVLVLDLAMPRMDGLEVLRRLQRDPRGTRVVVLSAYTDPALIAEAANAGGWAYISKGASTAELVGAVRDAVAGRRHASIAAQAGGTEHGTLSAREGEVLRLAARGRTAREIAVELGISPRTAEVHRRNLMRKLGLRTQTDLVRYAIAAGIVPTEA